MDVVAITAKGRTRALSPESGFSFASADEGSRHLLSADSATKPCFNSFCVVGWRTSNSLVVAGSSPCSDLDVFGSTALCLAKGSLAIFSFSSSLRRSDNPLIRQKALKVRFLI